MLVAVLLVFWYDMSALHQKLHRFRCWPLRPYCPSFASPGTIIKRSAAAPLLDGVVQHNRCAAA